MGRRKGPEVKPKDRVEEAVSVSVYRLGSTRGRFENSWGDRLLLLGLEIKGKEDDQRDEESKYAEVTY